MAGITAVDAQAVRPGLRGIGSTSLVEL